MRGLLAVSLLATGLVVAQAGAQRAVSSGRSGFSSAPHSFAPAPRISGGFGGGGLGAGRFSAPRSVSSAPQYHWSAPGNTPGRMGMALQSHMQYGSQHEHGPSDPDSRHDRRPEDPGSRYRQAYAPYFYANSTYLVPGTLNSYWDAQDGFDVNDESAPSGSEQENSNYQEEAAQGDSYQQSEREPFQGPNQGAYQAQDVPPPPSGPVEPLPSAALTLVFKDGHSQQIRNYAMTQTTLYVLDDAASGHRPEIPLNLINVAATEKMNRDAGVDFNVPAAAQ